MDLASVKRLLTPPEEEPESSDVEEVDVEEEEADDLWEALTLLVESHEVLRGILDLDAHKDFLNGRAVTDLEDLRVKIAEILDEYQLDYVSDAYVTIMRDHQ